MPLVRTALQPTIVLEVSDRELWRLAQLGVLLNDWRALYVSFFYVPDGPPDDQMTGLSVTVRNASNSVVLTGTGSAIQKVATGVWLYRVPEQTTLPDGTYTATWVGTDGQGDQVEAVDTVTVSPPPVDPFLSTY